MVIRVLIRFLNEESESPFESREYPATERSSERRKKTFTGGSDPTLCVLSDAQTLRVRGSLPPAYFFTTAAPSPAALLSNLITNPIP